MGRRTLPPNGRPPQPPSARHASLSPRERPGVVSSSRIGLIFRSWGGIRAMTDQQFDRSIQDLGNIVNLGHVNVCISQFHLPTGRPDVLRGVTGLVARDRAALLERLTQMRKPLEGTKFDFRESNDCVETICPWGNRINVHAPDETRFGRIVLGMPYIEFDVRPGTADRIAHFYRDVMGALATVIESADVRKARVQVGEKQYWYFRETDEPE